MKVSEKYQAEKEELLNLFLERTFFDCWRRFDDKNKETKIYSNAELQITSKCNLDCLYCYYTNNKKLNTPKISNSVILENTDKLIEWWEKNGFFPGKIDIFSGEPFIHKCTYDVITKIIDYYYKHNKSAEICIPTNMTWLNNDKIVEKVESLLDYAKSKYCYIYLSASVDGKYMDIENRPPKNHSKAINVYNDEFYTKLFKFIKKHNCGVHPMTYYNRIEYAIKNFMWFQENFKRYDIPWWNIYILEIRNAGWTPRQANLYKDFLKYIMNWVLHTKLNGDKSTFINNFIFNNKQNNIPKMNLFGELGSHVRGIGCSMQTTMGIRLIDLTVNSCHRMSYESQNGFKLVGDKEKGLKPIPLNFEFYLATHNYNVVTAPYCQYCVLKHTCSGGCLGSNFESTGDWFTVHPSVCLVLFAKHLAIVEFLVENNIFNEVIGKIKKEKQITFNLLKKWRY